MKRAQLKKQLAAKFAATPSFEKCYVVTATGQIYVFGGYHLECAVIEKDAWGNVINTSPTGTASTAYSLQSKLGNATNQEALELLKNEGCAIIEMDSEDGKNIAQLAEMMKQAHNKDHATKQLANIIASSLGR